MKNSKIMVALVLAGLFAFSSSVFAADKGKGKGKANPIVEKLNLSDTQKKDFMALQKETAAKRKEAGQDRDAQKKVQADFQAKLAKILDKDQLETFKKAQAEMRKGKGGDKGKGKGGDKGKGKKKKDSDN